MADAIFALLISAVVLWVAAPVAVICLPRGTLRLTLAAVAGAAGGAASCCAGILALSSSSASVGSLGTWFGIGDLALQVDALSGFFLTLTGGTAAMLFVARAATLPRMRGKLHIVALAGLLISLQLLFVADNTFLFMFGWEGVAVCFYLLVASGFPYHSAATDAAQWTMIMTRIGGAAVLAAFLCLAAATHSVAFSSFRTDAPGVALGLGTAAFVLALIGFGVKMALLPLQSWLPRAYPAAPLGAPAFLAAVALNAGFYGFIRFIGLLGPLQLWWGLTVLLVGAVTAFGGILYAAVQTNLKALIAYSSVENVGIILCGIGASMTGRAAHVPLLAGLGLTAALAQIAVHTVAKAGLFVSADAVERHAGTTDMERLGGLARSMPAVAGVFLVGALTLIGLPSARRLRQRVADARDLDAGFPGREPGSRRLDGRLRCVARADSRDCRHRIREGILCHVSRDAEDLPTHRPCAPPHCRGGWRSRGMWCGVRRRGAVARQRPWLGAVRGGCAGRIPPGFDRRVAHRAGVSQLLEHRSHRAGDCHSWLRGPHPHRGRADAKPSYPRRSDARMELRARSTAGDNSVHADGVEQSHQGRVELVAPHPS